MNKSFLMASGMAVLSAMPFSRAVDVTLLTNDPFGFTSFDTGLNWDDSTAPSVANDYFTNNFTLRTPDASSLDHVFAGNSLTLDPGGTLSYKGTGAHSITVNDLIFKGGQVFNGVSASTLNLTGNASLTGNGTFFSSVDSSDRTINFLGNLTGAGALTATGLGTVNLSGGGIQYTGPTAVTGGRLKLTDATAFASDISLGANTLQLNANTEWTLTSPITGSGLLQKIGGSRVYLNSDMSGFTGNVEVNLGNLRINNAGALGDSIGGTTVNGGNGAGAVRLELTGGINLAEPLTLNGVTAGRASVVSISGNNTLSGPISVNAPGNLVQFQSDSGLMTISGNISGSTASNQLIFFRGSSGGVVTGDIDLAPGSRVGKTEDSTWTVGAAGHTYNWSSFINSRGTTKMGAANVLPADSSLTVGQNDNANATFDLNGFDQTVASISANLGTGGNKQITSSTGAATFTVNAASNPTFAGRFNGAGLTLVKSGGGTLTLSGNNLHGGTTRVEAGTLRLVNATNSNTLSASNTLDVRSGAVLDVSGLSGGILTLSTGQTLTGSGQVAGGLIIGDGSEVSPGASPGTLTTGAQTWEGGGGYVFELDEVDPLTVAQTAFQGLNNGADWMNVNGNVDVTADALNPFIIRVRGLQSNDTPGAVSFWDPDATYKWAIATASGTVSGALTESFTIDDSAFTNNNSLSLGKEFFVTSDANHVYLNYGAVPEPHSLILLVGGGLLLLRRLPMRS